MIFVRSCASLIINTNKENLDALEAKLWEHIGVGFPDLMPESQDLPSSHFKHDESGNLMQASQQTN